MNKPLLVVLGPTASGKTRFAVQLADALGGEIISGDSRQVYREMDIGTGKDLESYTLEGRNITHHLIDVVSPEEHFDLSLFMQAFHQAYDAILSRHRPAVFTGGSGLYLEAVIKGFEFPFIPINEQEREILEGLYFDELIKIFHSLPTTSYQSLADLTTKKRTIRAIEITKYLIDHPSQLNEQTKYTPLVFGLNPSMEVRYKNIHERLMQRMQEGLVEEAQRLLDKLGYDKLIKFGLEYKFLAMYLTGQLQREEMIAKLEIAIRQFAKRQMTYFRKMEKSGIPIQWIEDASYISPVIEVSRQFMNNF